MTFPVLHKIIKMILVAAIAVFFCLFLVKDESSLAPQDSPTVFPAGFSLNPKTQIAIKKLTTEQIGEIYEILFYQPTKSLFMSVIESDGTRCVWRWTETGERKKVFIADNASKNGDLKILSTQSDFLLVEHTNPERIYRSEDNGDSWKLVKIDSGIFWAIAQNDSKTKLYATSWAYNEAKIYQSDDSGKTWRVWKDFQKLFPEYAVQYLESDPRFQLRHLHGVIFKDNTIYVGTGDKARFTFASNDNGETWRKIWDEGFTASVLSENGEKILFGPDKLRSSGIALYDPRSDEIRETWLPKPNGYAGYVYSMIQVDGVYYAAIHTEANEITNYNSRYGLIASPDAEQWFPLIEYGPIENTTSSTTYVAAGDNEIFFSVDGELFKFSPLKKTDFLQLEKF